MGDRFERLREMRDGYESALDEAARLRDDYHREVIKLHRSGVSLREIADALGISHQRVHQIVSPVEETPARRRKKARNAVVASAIAVAILGGGIFLTRASTSPDSPPAPRAEPIRQDKLEACARFIELFENQPSITRRLDCGELLRAKTGHAVALLDPRTGEVLALRADVRALRA